MINRDIAPGGTINRSNNSAPKEIKSDNLVSFSCSYFLYGEISRNFDSSYGISVKKDASGKFVLSEEGHKISCETDEAYLCKVQEIIKNNNLASINGMDKHTSGLPAEFQPCYFKASYDTGESLYFSINNDPQSKWGRELLKVTREEFTKHGITDLNLPVETSQVTRFQLTYTQGDMYYTFSEVQVPVEGVHKSLAQLAEEGYGEGEYETKLQYQVLNRTNPSERRDYRCDVDEAFYEGLCEIISKSDIEDFATLSRAPINFDYNGAKVYYDFYIEFKYGNRLYGFSDDAQMNEKFDSIVGEIMEYIKAYMKVE